MNVEEPWYIKDRKLDSESKKLDIWLDFKRGSRFPCPKCGKPNCSAYDTKEKVLQHINYFQYPTYLHIRTPRVMCSNCGILQIRVPWARELSHFTLRLLPVCLTLVLAGLKAYLEHSIQLNLITDRFPKELGEH